MGIYCLTYSDSYCHNGTLLQLSQGTTSQHHFDTLEIMTVSNRLCPKKNNKHLAHGVPDYSALAAMLKVVDNSEKAENQKRFGRQEQKKGPKANPKHWSTRNLKTDGQVKGSKPRSLAKLARQMRRKQCAVARKAQRNHDCKKNGTEKLRSNSDSDWRSGMGFKRVVRKVSCR